MSGSIKPSADGWGLNVKIGPENQQQFQLLEGLLVTQSDLPRHDSDSSTLLGSRYVDCKNGTGPGVGDDAIVKLHVIL